MDRLVGDKRLRLAKSRSSSGGGVNSAAVRLRGAASALLPQGSRSAYSAPCRSPRAGGSAHAIATPPPNAATPRGRDTPMDQALRDKGLANRKAVLGEDYVNKAMGS